MYLLLNMGDFNCHVSVPEGLLNSGWIMMSFTWKSFKQVLMVQFCAHGYCIPLSHSLRWCHAGFFFVYILAKNCFEHETSMKPTNFSPGFVISSSDMMYTLLVFLPVAMRIEIFESNQDCNIWECCSARFQLACGSVRKRTKKNGQKNVAKNHDSDFF